MFFYTDWFSCYTTFVPHVDVSGINAACSKRDSDLVGLYYHRRQDSLNLWRKRSYHKHTFALCVQVIYMPLR